MKKVAEVEKRNRQQVYRTLAQLTKRQPADDQDVLIFDLYIHEYEQLVSKMFSANVFFKGMIYACKIYKHTVKVEYRLFCQLIIQKIEDPSLREQVLQRMRRRRNVLLKNAPSEVDWSHGFEIFYRLTGGFRQKYRKDRKAIEQIHEEFAHAASIPLYPLRYWQQRASHYFQYMKMHLVWRLRSHISE